jgi:hypothetical protein
MYNEYWWNVKQALFIFHAHFTVVALTDWGYVPAGRLGYTTVSYDVPHFCALPTPISHTLVWEIQGRNINLARAFPSCKKN